MGYYKNTGDQALRVDDGSGRLRRVPAGGVVNASGDFEKNLKDQDGVESASKEDMQTTQPSPGSQDLQRTNDLVAAATDANRLITTVPLNTVVGDSDAPYGPENGVITTKQALMREGDRERRAFGDHEALPEDAEDENKSEIHRAQAENKVAVEEATKSSIQSSEETPEGAGEGRKEQPTVAKAAAGRREQKDTAS